MLICFTGIDGCGKSTQVSLLRDYLRKQGKKVYVSKAYGDVEKKIFSTYIEGIKQEALLFLFQAFHIQQRLKAVNAIKKGEIVVADRWDESYIAYHSQRGILSRNKELRKELNSIAFRNIIPELTFLLDLSVREAQKRIKARGGGFFDQKSVEYHEMMRKGYLMLAEKRGWYILDAKRSPDILHQAVTIIVNNIF